LQKVRNRIALRAEPQQGADCPQAETSAPPNATAAWSQKHVEFVVSGGVKPAGSERVNQRDEASATVSCRIIGCVARLQAKPAADRRRRLDRQEHAAAPPADWTLPPEAAASERLARRDDRQRRTAALLATILSPPERPLGWHVGNPSFTLAEPSAAAPSQQRNGVDPKAIGEEDRLRAERAAAAAGLICQNHVRLTGLPSCQSFQGCQVANTAGRVTYHPSPW
jgi:hypothetical protein